MISIIVVTHDRKVLLQQCIQSLLMQDFHGSYEIIVVDNASTDGTGDYIKSVFSGGIKYLRNRCRRDLALCKEQAIQSALGDVIAFTDDDCVVAPGWFENIRESMQAHDIVGGIVLPLGSVAFPGWWRHSMEWIVGINSNPGMNFLPLGSNVAFRRNIFKSLDATPYHPCIGPYGEDNVRLRISLQAGFKLVINKNMIVYHHITADRLKFSYFVRRSYTEGQCLATREPIFYVFLLMILALLINPFRFFLTWDMNRLFRMCVNMGYIVTYLQIRR
ncbi:MAG: glycosyltransferase family 2 protein [Candidatus Omnitrophota bacterium]